MKKVLAILVLLGAGIAIAYAQSQMTSAPAYSGAPVNRATVNGSVTISTGKTFQVALASILGTSTQRQALTIVNNNETGDNCWVFLGAASAMTPTSILLTKGSMYQRYWPFVPSDEVQVTCNTTGSSLYIDTQ